MPVSEPCVLFLLHLEESSGFSPQSSSPFADLDVFVPPHANAVDQWGPWDEVTSAAWARDALKPLQAMLKGERSKEDSYNVHNKKIPSPWVHTAAKIQVYNYRTHYGPSVLCLIAWQVVMNRPVWSWTFMWEAASSPLSGSHRPICQMDSGSLMFCCPWAEEPALDTLKERVRSSILPQPNQSFVVGVCSVVNVTYQSYRRKKKKSHLTCLIHLLPLMMPRAVATASGEGVLTASVARFSQLPCTSRPSS